MVIARFHFQIMDQQRIEMPRSATILTFNVKMPAAGSSFSASPSVEMFAAVNPTDVTTVYRDFITLSSGQKGPDAGVIYIGSFFIHNVGCHVFEVIEREDPENLEGVI